MMGSPLYMSPEQVAASKNVDKRADIWALGVMLFELVTGERPFQAETLPQIVMVLTTQPPTKLESIMPDAPPGLSAVIEKCLTKPQDERYENVGALAKALEPFAPPGSAASIERIVRVASGTAVRRQRTGRTSPDPSSSQPITPIETAPTMASQPAPKMLPPLEQTNLDGSVQTSPPPVEAPRKKRAGLFIALGAVALLGVGIAVLARHTDPTRAPAASVPSVMEAKDAALAPFTASAEPTKAPEPVPSVSATASGSAPSWIVKAPPPPKPTQTQTPPKPSASVAKPNCDPPYVIDAVGNKKYKMECL
jgi:serine/threonine-protein kinase